MLRGEHSAILLTFIKLPFIIKIFILSIFEWPFYTGFTVNYQSSHFVKNGLVTKSLVENILRQVYKEHFKTSA